MAKPADCAHCQKPATIHLTQIVDGKITKLDFCEDCPHQKAISDPAAFSLAQVLAAHGDGEINPAALETPCEQCGMTLRSFKKTGRLGCAHCYEHFRSIITQMLPQMQSGDTHTGKHPLAMLERMEQERRVAHLQTSLAEAVRTEAYEEAARLRDELNRWQETAEVAGESAAKPDNAASNAVAKGAGGGVAGMPSEAEVKGSKTAKDGDKIDADRTDADRTDGDRTDGNQTDGDSRDSAAGGAAG